MTVSRKSFADVRVKNADEGLVELVFATFNKVDHDNDVTLKGAFTGNPAVAISAWKHSSWDGALPYGVGEIHETATEAVAEVKFLMDTTHGRDAFLTVKALSEAGIQEWSYSLQDVQAKRGTFEGKAVRILEKVTVKEVSPLLRGAGTDTRTLAVKAAKQLNSGLARLLRDAGKERWGSDDAYVYPADYDVDDGYVVYCIYSDEEPDRMIRVDFTRDDTSVTLSDNETDVEEVTSYAPKGAKFSEHLDFALRGVKQLSEMAQQRLTQRAAEGKAITEQTDAYDQLMVELTSWKQAIDATHTNPPEADDAFANELVRFYHSQGVPT